ncbi:MAG: YkvA family protein [Alphaproteobacteria bacterium]
MTDLIERPVDEARLKRDSYRVRRGFWPKLRKFARAIPFSDDLLAAYYCATDRQTPTYVKAVLMGAVAYFVVPTDMIPDFVAGLGFTDDAGVLLTAIRAVGGEIKPTHRAQAEETLADVTDDADAASSPGS